MIFETHAHYDDAAYDLDREQIIKGLPEKNVGYVVNIGASMESTRATVALTRQYDFVYGAVGVHPNEVGDMTEQDIQELKTLAAEEKIIAIGEIGLDYYYEEPAPAIQKKWFERQIELARQVNMPVVIHSREAAKDTIDMMQALRCGDIGGVIHCYSYSKESAKHFLDMDYFFGIGGVVTFKNAKKLKEAVAYIPIEKIVVETDSPYLSPVPFRGKRNASNQIAYVIDAIAEIKGMTPKEVETITFENAKTLYKMK